MDIQQDNKIKENNKIIMDIIWNCMYDICLFY